MPQTPMCTIYDIEINVPELYSRENDKYSEPLGLMLENIQIFSAEVARTLQPYFGLDLDISPYITNPIARRGNADNDCMLRKPTITDSTSLLATITPDTYTILFTDGTNYQLSCLKSGTVTSGKIDSDTTSADGFLVIKTTDWSGSFSSGDKFTFAIECYEEVLRLITAYKTAQALLSARYVSEQANTMQPVRQTYGGKADTLLQRIYITGDIKLECADSDEGGPPDSRESWHGYNIDEYGYEQPPPTGVERDVIEE